MPAIRNAPHTVCRSGRPVVFRGGVKVEAVDVKPVLDSLDIKPKVEGDDEGQERRLRSAGPPVHVKLEVAIVVKVEEVEEQIPAVGGVAALVVPIEYCWAAKRIVSLVFNKGLTSENILAHYIRLQVNNMQGYWLIDWEDSRVTAAEFKFWKGGVKCHDDVRIDVLHEEHEMSRLIVPMWSARREWVVLREMVAVVGVKEWDRARAGGRMEVVASK
ncbi:hypothetical protein P7C70_g7795, partial [Phenoliferia sp. Uapishka_3]